MEDKTKTRHWTAADERYIRDNFGKITIDDIARALGRSRLAVQLYAHRHRMTVGNKVRRNLVQEILKIKFTHVEDFQPSRSFYNTVGIGQRRWWQLYFGDKPILQDEYIAIARYFGITLQEAFDARQLSIFEEDCL